MRMFIRRILKMGLAIAGALVLLTALFVSFAAQRARAAGYGMVLISEIMYDPAAGYAPGNAFGQPPGADGPWEWVELYNAGSAPVDIGGWKLTDEEHYPVLDGDYDGVCTITAGTVIPAGGFLVVAQADISADLPPTATLSICDPGARPVTQTFEMGRDGGEVLALLDDADRVVAGSLETPFPDIAGQNVGDSIGLRYPAYGWSRNNADWAVESRAYGSPYNHHTAGAANTGWTWATTPHDLSGSLDGTVITPTEWNPDGEYLGKANGVEFYLTWDAARLFAGFSGQNALTGTYIVALDTDPLARGAANSGAVTALCGSAAFSPEHKPNFAIQVGPGGMTALQAVGGAWSAWTPSAATAAASNGAANGQAEFQIAFSDLGLTYGRPVGAYLFVCDAPAGAVRAAWPPENATASSTSLNTGLDVALVLNAPGDFQSPRYEAARMGVFTMTISTGDYRLWDDYMWFHVITPTTSTLGSCQVVVRVMGNRMPTSQGAPSRRAYEFNADTCPGMAVNLNFAYEAGDTPTNGKVQAAPNELLGMTENRLTLSRFDGSSWQLMSEAADSQCTGGFSGGTWRGCPPGTYNYDHNTTNNLLTIYNVSTFSTWTFSDQQDGYSPTAVTLEWVRARSGGEAAPFGAAAGGAGLLLAGLWLLGRRTRRRRGA